MISQKKEVLHGAGLLGGPPALFFIYFDFLYLSTSCGELFNHAFKEFYLHQIHFVPKYFLIFGVLFSENIGGETFCS